MELHDFYPTSEYILSVTTQEKIFETYLYKPDLTTSFVNPFRKDKSPGCKFYYNSAGRLYFVDWAMGMKHYDCFKVVQEYYRCSFPKALQYIIRDLDQGVLERKVSESDFHHSPKQQRQLKIKTRDFNEKELAFWNIGGLSITQETLQAHGIYAVQTIWEGDWIIDQCKMTFAYIEDGYLTQIYFPNNKHTGRRRFINHSGYKVGGISSLPLQSEYIVISKAHKCRFFMKMCDIPNVNIIAESMIIDEEMYNFLKSKYKRVIYVADNDYPGRRAAVKYRQKYPDIIILMFPRDCPKDFTDNLAAFGIEHMLQLKKRIYNQLINKL